MSAEDEKSPSQDAKTIPNYETFFIMNLRCGEVETHLAHNQEIAGANPAAATNFGVLMGYFHTGQRWSKKTRKMLLKNKTKKVKLTARKSSIDTSICPPRQTYRPPSLNSGAGVAVKKDNQVYTGSNMKGIGTLHKSNAVPIFTDEEAKDQANMRR